MPEHQGRRHASTSPASSRAYEELIRKVRVGGITPDDFAGTTGTITNPGTIGTVHSVPRLMPGQGFILGVGAIGYPAEYEGADPHTVARLGISKVITLTSTYDHRVIQGAESGEFLRAIHDLLLGAHDFYDDIFESFGVPYEPARWTTDIEPARRRDRRTTRRSCTSTSSSTCTGCAATSSRTSTRSAGASPTRTPSSTSTITG